MDMLILGETIRGKSPVVYLGYWMPSRGNDGAGGIETFLVSAADKFTVKLQTKTAEEADPGTSSGIIGSTSISSTTPQVFRFGVTDAKELVRYLITADDGTNDQYMHFQLLTPQWAEN